MIIYIYISVLGSQNWVEGRDFPYTSTTTHAYLCPLSTSSSKAFFKIYVLLLTVLQVSPISLPACPPPPNPCSTPGILIDGMKQAIEVLHNRLPESVLLLLGGGGGGWGWFSVGDGSLERWWQKLGLHFFYHFSPENRSLHMVCGTEMNWNKLSADLHPTMNKRLRGISYLRIRQHFLFESCS